MPRGGPHSVRGKRFGDALAHRRFRFSTVEFLRQPAILPALAKRQEGRRWVVVQCPADHEGGTGGSSSRLSGPTAGGVGDARDRAATTPIVPMSTIGSRQSQSPTWPLGEADWPPLIRAMSALVPHGSTVMMSEKPRPPRRGAPTTRQQAPTDRWSDGARARDGCRRQRKRPFDASAGAGGDAASSRRARCAHLVRASLTWRDGWSE